MPLPIICFQPPVSQPLAPYEDSPVGDKYGGRYVLHLATVHEHIGLVGLRALDNARQAGSRPGKNQGPDGKPYVGEGVTTHSQSPAFLFATC
eukprot:scaffold133881_cov16-Tisochrysis_lutea.AAC.1